LQMQTQDGYDQDSDRLQDFIDPSGFHQVIYSSFSKGVGEALDILGEPPTKTRARRTTHVNYPSLLRNRNGEQVEEETTIGMSSDTVFQRSRELHYGSYALEHPGIYMHVFARSEETRLSRALTTSTLSYAEGIQTTIDRAKYEYALASGPEQQATSPTPRTTLNSRPRSRHVVPKTSDVIRRHVDALTNCLASSPTCDTIIETALSSSSSADRCNLSHSPNAPGENEDPEAKRVLSNNSSTWSLDGTSVEVDQEARRLASHRAEEYEMQAFFDHYRTRIVNRALERAKARCRIAELKAHLSSGDPATMSPAHVAQVQREIERLRVLYTGVDVEEDVAFLSQSDPLMKPAASLLAPHFIDESQDPGVDLNIFTPAFMNDLDSEESTLHGESNRSHCYGNGDDLEIIRNEAGRPVPFTIARDSMCILRDGQRWKKHWIEFSVGPLTQPTHRITNLVASFPIFYAAEEPGFYFPETWKNSSPTGEPRGPLVVPSPLLPDSPPPIPASTVSLAWAHVAEGEHGPSLLGITNRAHEYVRRKTMQQSERLVHLDSNIPSAAELKEGFKSEMKAICENIRAKSSADGVPYRIFWVVAEGRIITLKLTNQGLADYLSFAFRRHFRNACSPVQWKRKTLAFSIALPTIHLQALSQISLQAEFETTAEYMRQERALRQQRVSDAVTAAIQEARMNGVTDPVELARIASNVEIATKQQLHNEPALSGKPPRVTRIMQAVHARKKEKGGVVSVQLDPAMLFEVNQKAMPTPQPSTITNNSLQSVPLNVQSDLVTAYLPHYYAGMSHSVHHEPPFYFYKSAFKSSRSKTNKHQSADVLHLEKTLERLGHPGHQQAPNEVWLPKYMLDSSMDNEQSENGSSSTENLKQDDTTLVRVSLPPSSLASRFEAVTAPQLFPFRDFLFTIYPGVLLCYRDSRTHLPSETILLRHCSIELDLVSMARGEHTFILKTPLRTLVCRTRHAVALLEWTSRLGRASAQVMEIENQTRGPQFISTLVEPVFCFQMLLLASISKSLSEEGKSGQGSEELHSLCSYLRPGELPVFGDALAFGRRRKIAAARIRTEASEKLMAEIRKLHQDQTGDSSSETFTMQLDAAFVDGNQQRSQEAGAAIEGDRSAAEMVADRVADDGATDRLPDRDALMSNRDPEGVDGTGDEEEEVFDEDEGQSAPIPDGERFPEEGRGAEFDLPDERAANAEDLELLPPRPAVESQPNRVEYISETGLLEQRQTATQNQAGADPVPNTPLTAAEISAAAHGNRTNERALVSSAANVLAANATPLPLPTLEHLLRGEQILYEQKVNAEGNMLLPTILDALRWSSITDAGLAQTMDHDPSNSISDAVTTPPYMSATGLASLFGSLSPLELPRALSPGSSAYSSKWACMLIDNRALFSAVISALTVSCSTFLAIESHAPSLRSFARFLAAQTNAELQSRKIAFKLACHKAEGRGEPTMPDSLNLSEFERALELGKFTDCPLPNLLRDLVFFRAYMQFMSLPHSHPRLFDFASQLYREFLFPESNQPTRVLSSVGTSYLFPNMWQLQDAVASRVLQVASIASKLEAKPDEPIALDDNELETFSFSSFYRGPESAAHILATTGSSGSTASAELDQTQFVNATEAASKCLRCIPLPITTYIGQVLEAVAAQGFVSGVHPLADFYNDHCPVISPNVMRFAYMYAQCQSQISFDESLVPPNPNTTFTVNQWLFYAASHAAVFGLPAIGEPEAAVGVGLPWPLTYTTSQAPFNRLPILRSNHADASPSTSHSHPLSLAAKGVRSAYLAQVYTVLPALLKTLFMPVAAIVYERLNAEFIKFKFTSEFVKLSMPNATESKSMEPNPSPVGSYPTLSTFSNSDVQQLTTFASNANVASAEVDGFNGIRMPVPRKLTRGAGGIVSTVVSWVAGSSSTPDEGNNPRNTALVGSSPEQASSQWQRATSAGPCPSPSQAYTQNQAPSAPPLRVLSPIDAIPYALRGSSKTEPRFKVHPAAALMLMFVDQPHHLQHQLQLQQNSQPSVTGNDDDGATEDAELPNPVQDGSMLPPEDILTGFDLAGRAQGIIQLLLLPPPRKIIRGTFALTTASSSVVPQQLMQFVSQCLVHHDIISARTYQVLEEIRRRSLRTPTERFALRIEQARTPHVPGAVLAAVMNSSGVSGSMLGLPNGMALNTGTGNTIASTNTGVGGLGQAFSIVSPHTHLKTAVSTPSSGQALGDPLDSQVKGPQEPLSLISVAEAIRTVQFVESVEPQESSHLGPRLVTMPSLSIPAPSLNLPHVTPSPCVSPTVQDIAQPNKSKLHSLDYPETSGLDAVGSLDNGFEHMPPNGVRLSRSSTLPVTSDPALAFSHGSGLGGLDACDASSPLDPCDTLGPLSARAGDRQLKSNASPVPSSPRSVTTPLNQLSNFIRPIAPLPLSLFKMPKLGATATPGAHDDADAENELDADPFLGGSTLRTYSSMPRSAAIAYVNKYLLELGGSCAATAKMRAELARAELNSLKDAPSGGRYIAYAPLVSESNLKEVATKLPSLIPNPSIADELIDLLSFTPQADSITRPQVLLVAPLGESLETVVAAATSDTTDDQIREFAGEGSLTRIRAQDARDAAYSFDTAVFGMSAANLVQGKPLFPGNTLDLGSCMFLLIRNSETREITKFDLNPGPPNAPPVSLSVGREKENGLVLLDCRVSRSHARLMYSATTCHFLDLGSSGGSRYNGRIVAHTHLKPGDWVELGHTAIVFQAIPPVERILTSALGDQEVNLLRALYNVAVTRVANKQSSYFDETADDDSAQPLITSKLPTAKSIRDKFESTRSSVLTPLKSVGSTILSGLLSLSPLSVMRSPRMESQNTPSAARRLISFFSLSSSNDVNQDESNKD